MTEMEELKAEVERLREVLYYRKALAELELETQEVLFVLGGIDDDDEKYRAIVKMMTAQFEAEQQAAFAPGSEGVRDYNAGRAAAVSDMISVLEQMRRKGRESRGVN